MMSNALQIKRIEVKDWGAFSLHSSTPLIRVENGSLTSERYVQVLTDNLLPHIQNLLPQGGLFQQDNAPAHSARATKAFFQDNNIHCFPWPSTSPDMNHIEIVWGYMENILKRDYERPTSCDELFYTLEQIWHEIMDDYDYRKNLIDSMPRRIFKLYEVQGSYTKY